MAYNPAIFEQQRRALLNNYTANRSVSDYANFVSGQRGARGLSQLRNQFQEQRRPLVSSFGRRGQNTPTVKSGSFRRAMIDYAKKQTEGIADYQRNIDEQNQQYGLQSRQQDAQYQQDLADIERQKADQINQDAMAIWQMRMGV